MSPTQSLLLTNSHLQKLFTNDLYAKFFKFCYHKFNYPNKQKQHLSILKFLMTPR